MAWGYKVAVFLVGLLIFLAHREVPVEEKKKESETEEHEE